MKKPATPHDRPQPTTDRLLADRRLRLVTGGEGRDICTGQSSGKRQHGTM